MERTLAVLSSPAALLGLLAAVCWAPVTGFPTWPALSRGRLASTVVISAAIGVFVFFATRQAGVAAGS
jgi:hypothetical protein